MKKYLLLMAVMVLPLVFTGCGGDDEEEIDFPSKISLYVDNEYVLGDGAKGATSANPFVASVADGIVTGNHVGTTVITVGNQQIATEVNGIYHLYNDPVTDWGCSVSDVKSRQKQGTLSGKSTSELVVYENAGSATLIGYSFKSGKLSGVVVYLPSSVGATISKHLMERYVMLPYYVTDDVLAYGVDAYEEEDARTAVTLMMPNVSRLAVTYMPYSQSH